MNESYEHNQMNGKVAGGKPIGNQQRSKHTHTGKEIRITTTKNK